MPEHRLVYSSAGWRYLQPGEIIEEGDQIRASSRVWVQTAKVGEKVPPRYAQEFRRRLERASPKSKENP